MGKWAKKIFGQETFGEIGLVVAGTNRQEFEKEILGFFDEVVSSKDSVYHTHLAKKNGITYPVVFNIYGAPAMIDVMTEMHDGGCRIIIFVGYAYGGFKNLDIGSLVVPNKSHHFDGVYHPIEPDRKVAYPDEELKKKTEEILKKNKLDYVNGTNISVPSVTFQLPHANEEYQKIQPSTVEMELAACFSRAKDIGIRAVGILVISDNRKVGIGDEEKKKDRYLGMRGILEKLVGNIVSFKLPPLPTEKEFDIDEHLANIIEDPSDKINVYRESK